MKELTISTSPVPTPHIAVGEKVNALTEQVKKHSPKLCGIKKNVHLCSALHSEQADRAANIAVGIFYAYGFGIVPTPVWSVNAPTACSRCSATGKRNFFCSLPVFYQPIVPF